MLEHPTGNEEDSDHDYSSSSSDHGDKENDFCKFHDTIPDNNSNFFSYHINW